MRVDRQSLTDLLSLRDAALILSTLHRRQVVFPLPPTPHAVALVLRHLWAHRHVSLPPCGPRGVKSVATLSSPLSSALTGKPRRAALVRLWGQLAKRVLSANEGCSVLFCHVCVAAVVLLQDVIPTANHDAPLAFKVRQTGRQWRACVGQRQAGPLCSIIDSVNRREYEPPHQAL